MASCDYLYLLTGYKEWKYEFGIIFKFFLVLFIFKMWPILNFMWMWKNFGYRFFSWCMKRPYIFMQLSSTKGFGGLSLLMECEGWIGKIFSVRWAWGKMRSVFLHHLTFNLAYVFTCRRKQSHPGFSTLTIRPLCLE